jgi:hypothetical protein
MKKLIVNNFRYIYGAPQKTKSDYLEYYKKICGYEVYKVTINNLAYVVYDQINDEYYNFERTNDNFENIDKDLKHNIEFRLPKID